MCRTSSSDAHRATGAVLLNPPYKEQPLLSPDESVWSRRGDYAIRLVFKMEMGYMGLFAKNLLIFLDIGR